MASVCARCLLRGRPAVHRRCPHSRGRMELWRSCCSERPGRRVVARCHEIRSGHRRVTVPRDSNGRVRLGSRVRRRDLEPADVVERRGLRATALPLTVIEAAVRRRGGARLMDSALQREVELRELWHAHLRNKGRYGSPAARRLLQAASDRARSEAERLLVKLLKEAGITGWRTNYPVGGYKVDVVFPGPKVAIETDGWAFHSDQDDFRTIGNARTTSRCSAGRCFASPGWTWSSIHSASSRSSVPRFRRDGLRSAQPTTPKSP